MQVNASKSTFLRYQKMGISCSKLIIIFIRVQIIAYAVCVLLITPAIAKSNYNPPNTIHNLKHNQKKVVKILSNKIINNTKKSSRPIQESEIKNVKVNPETIIINLDINNKLNYDYEVFVNNDGTFSLPFKSIAKLLDLSVNQNKITREITFTFPDGKSGNVDFQKQKITFGDKIIDLGKYNKMTFLKEGILEETRDEVFVPIKVLNEILNTGISEDTLNYSVSIRTSKLLSVLITYNNEKKKAENPFGNTPETDNTFTRLFIPKKNRLLSFDTLEVNSFSQFYSSTQIDQYATIKDSLFDSTDQIVLNGSLWRGKLKIKSNPRIMQNNILSPGGIGFGYKKEFKKYNLELGSLSGSKAGTFDIGQSILGVNINNEKNEERELQQESGLINPGSKVNVYINDKLISTVNTQGGYYSLKDVSSTKAGKLKLEEVTLEGKVSKLKENLYQPNPNLLAKGERQFAIISGIAGYDNYLFDSDSSINDYYAKKLTGGIKIRYGLTDNLTVNFAGLGDHIISLPNRQDFLNRISFNKEIMSILNSYRDFNPIHGQTGLLSFYYAPYENLSFNTDIGVSHASSIIDNEDNKIGPMGFCSVLTANYKKPLYSLSGSIFDYSPSFYMAGASGIGNNASYLNDKLGAELNSNILLKFISLNGGVNGYFSNLDKRLPGDVQKNWSYNYFVRMPFKNSSSLNYRQEGRIYNNSVGTIDNENFELSYNKRYFRSIEADLIGKLNSFANHYSNKEDNSGSTCIYKTLTAKLNYDIPKKLGKLDLAHDIVKINASDYYTNYNSLSIGYTPPIFKNITTSLSVGYHYAGINKGFDFSSSIGYVFSSGRIFQLNYQYNRQFGTFLDDIFIPTNCRHSISFNLSDAISLIGGNIKSVGSLKEDDGFIKAITFLDSNQNGKKDTDEPEISDIPLKISGYQNETRTNKKGYLISRGMTKGLYKINLDFDELPGLLSVSSGSQNEYLVKVDKNSQTEVYFGLISSVGNVNGKVDVKDQFNRQVDIKDLIITIYNENGEEVKYTAAEPDGSYSISGLSPGKYTVQIDKDFINEYHLVPKVTDISKTIVIPPVYKDYVDIKDVNLDYVQVISG